MNTRTSNNFALFFTAIGLVVFGAAAACSSVGKSVPFLPGLEAVAARPLVAWPLFLLTVWSALLVFSRHRRNDRVVYVTAGALGTSGLGLCLYLAPAAGVLMTTMAAAVGSRANAA